MNKKIKQKLLFLSILFLLTPFFALAQKSDEVFKAEVIEILEEREFVHQDGSRSIQQNIKLRGLEDKWQDKEIIFQGIDDFE